MGQPKRGKGEGVERSSPMGLETRWRAIDPYDVMGKGEHEALTIGVIRRAAAEKANARGHVPRRIWKRSICWMTLNGGRLAARVCSPIAVRRSFSTQLSSSDTTNCTGICGTA